MYAKLLNMTETHLNKPIKKQKHRWTIKYSTHGLVYY